MNCTRCGKHIGPGEAIQRSLPGMEPERLCPKCWGKHSEARDAEPPKDVNPLLEGQSNAG
jgi:hypothetical protein